MRKWWKDILLVIPALLTAGMVFIVVAVGRPEFPNIPFPDMEEPAQQGSPSPESPEQEDAIRLREDSGKKGKGKNQKKKTASVSKKQDSPTRRETLKKNAVYADGIYSGSGQGFGGQIRVNVTIQDGKIAEIAIVSHEKETADYFDRAKAVAGRILKKQSPDVDAVSGATYSSRGIMDAVTQALNKAAGKGKEAQQAEKDKKTDSVREKKARPMKEVADGTFEGSGICKVFKYTVNLKVTFRDGYIKKISGLHVTGNRNPANQSFWKRAYQTLRKSIIKEQSVKVDAVSGATYASNAVKDAYRDAYRKAVEAKRSNTASDNPAPSPSPEPDATMPPVDDKPKPSDEPSEGDNTQPPDEAQTSTGAAIDMALPESAVREEETQ